MEDPTGWLLEKKLSRQFWVFFTCRLFFDVGFSVYYFCSISICLTFTLTNELSAGRRRTDARDSSRNLASGWLARKIGLRPPLICCMIAAPLLGAARAVVMWEGRRLVWRFWPGWQCALGRLLSAHGGKAYKPRRTVLPAFSLIFSASIGRQRTGRAHLWIFASLVEVGRLCDWASDSKRMILLGACGLASIGLIPCCACKTRGMRANIWQRARLQSNRGRLALFCCASCHRWHCGRQF